MNKVTELASVEAEVLCLVAVPAETPLLYDLPFRYHSKVSRD